MAKSLTTEYKFHADGSCNFNLHIEVDGKIIKLECESEKQHDSVADCLVSNGFTHHQWAIESTY